MMIHCKECSMNQFFVVIEENHMILTCNNCFTPVTLFGSVEEGE